MLIRIWLSILRTIEYVWRCDCDLESVLEKIGSHIELMQGDVYIVDCLNGGSPHTIKIPKEDECDVLDCGNKKLSYTHVCMGCLNNSS